jgi:hypothetical protein
MPGQNVEVVISYVHLLKFDENKYEWTFPMVVGPRYTPRAATPFPASGASPARKRASRAIRAQCRS